MRIEEIKLSKLVSDKDNPRKSMEDIEELAHSLEVNGQQEPLSVEDLGNGNFLVDNGNRRFNAFHVLWNKTKKEPMVKCIVGQNLNQEERLWKQCVIENQNKKWSVHDRDKAWKKLWVKSNKNKKEFAKRLGTNLLAIDNFLDRIQLPEEIQKLNINTSTLMETRTLDKDTRVKLLKRVKKEDMGRQAIRNIKKVLNNTDSKVLKDAVIEGKIKPEHAEKVKGLSEERQRSAIFVSEVAKEHLEEGIKILEKKSITTKSEEKKKEIMKASDFVSKLEDSILDTANQLIAIKGIMEQINDENLDVNFTSQMKNLLLRDLKELKENSLELNKMINKQKQKWGM